MMHFCKKKQKPEPDIFVYLDRTSKIIINTKVFGDSMAEVKPVKAGWLNAFRPWTLHGAVVPVLIGGVVAFCDGSFDIVLFLLVLAGGLLLQSASNIINTYGDYVSGLDTVENETRSPELVTGTIEPRDMLIVGLACVGLTCLIGLVFIWELGWKILIYGLLGIAGATMYTIGISYKYLGLGQISVFLMMGILMPLGTYYVLTGEMFSWDVLILSLPNAFMITAVLCGNEMRDFDEDLEASVGTTCNHLGYERGMKLYLFENMVWIPLLALIIIMGYAPICSAIAYLALYDTNILYRNSKNARDDKHAGFMLVPLAFKQNWHVGVLIVVGYLIQYLMS